MRKTKKTTKKRATKKKKKISQKFERAIAHYKIDLAKATKYLSDFQHHKAQFPSLTGLALYMGVCRATIYNWARDERKPGFADLLLQIELIQHEMLIGQGLTGEYNSTIVKLVLAKHGYHDKAETRISVTDVSKLSEEEIDQRLKELENKNKESLKD